MCEHPIERLRRELGLTQQAVAKMAKTQQSTISEIVRRRADPSPAVARRLVKAFKGRLSFDDLYDPSRA